MSSRHGKRVGLCTFAKFGSKSRKNVIGAGTVNDCRPDRRGCVGDETECS